MATAHSNGNFITEYFDQSVPLSGDEPTSPSGTGTAPDPIFEPGGTSSNLDFRDADMTGTASIQVNGILGEPLQPPDTTQNWITISSKIAAHELGHLLGLHHADSFGPIGQGIYPVPGPGYNPTYTGPTNASETFDHIITSGDSVGADRWNDLRDLFFGEREDVVLAYGFAAPATAGPAGSLLVAQQGSPSQANPQQLTLASLQVPNTQVYGRDAGKTFSVQAVDVLGTIGLDATNHAEKDYYSFTGTAGDVMNINVMSQGISRYANLGSSGYFDPQVTLYLQNANGPLTQVAFNDDVFPASATGDSSLVDFVLPTSGTYVIKVNSFAFATDPHVNTNGFTAEQLQNYQDAVNGTDTGKYELFLYRFQAGVATSGADTFVPGTGAATIVNGAGSTPVLSNLQAVAFTTVVGDSSAHPLATFTSAMNGTIYSATINWGDGSTTAAAVSIVGNQVTLLSIPQNHQYAHPGTYSLTIAIDAGGSEVDLTSQATVSKATPSYSALAAPTVTYGATSDTVSGKLTLSSPAGTLAPAGGVYITVNGVTQSATIAGDGSFSSSFDTHTWHANTYTVSFHFAGNADFASPTDGATSLLVTPFAFSYQIGNDAQTYGRAANFATDLGTTIDTGVNGQKLAIAYSSPGDVATAHVGTYAISGVVSSNTGQAGDYVVTLTNGTLTVNRATLTVAANNLSRFFGLANPPLTYMITGFANNENAGVVSGTPILSTTATPASPVGSYPITVALGSLSADNYTFALQNGTLTVGSVATTTTGSASPSTASFGQTVTFTANVKSQTIGAGTPTGVVDFFDTTTGVDLGRINLSAGSASLGIANLPVGVNVITVSYLGDGNFTTSSVNLNETVNQSIIVVDPSAAGALNISGNTHLTFAGNITVDSSSTSALTASGNAIATAASIQVKGGVSKSGNAQLNPTAATGAAILANPVPTLALPSFVGLTTYAAANLGGNTVQPLNPGIYPSITISGNAKITMNPGTYVIQGGGFSESGNGVVTANGVILVIQGGGFSLAGNATMSGANDILFNTTTTNASGGAAGPISVSGNGQLKISAPLTGVYAGIAIFQPSFNSQTLTFSNNSISAGTVIAPGAQLVLGGNAQVNAALVVGKLVASGNVIAQAAAVATSGLTPAQVRNAYGFSQIQLAANGLAINGTGAGQTIAIVDAFDDPNIASDLQHFNQAFGLPDAHLTKAMPEGVPAADAGWSKEIALDVEWAHAIAPGASILLVEAISAAPDDMLRAVDFARQQPGVTTVSMSWGTSEFVTESSYDSLFTTPVGHIGVTFVAASGDTSGESLWPAVSPNVLAVGGTSLLTNSQGTYGSESSWSNSGGGLSAFESEPTYQGQIQGSGQRATPDVAYNADPNRGFAVYDTVDGTGWQSVGGTSAGAPQWAALIAIADQGRALQGLGSLDSAQTLTSLYQMANVPGVSFHPIGSSEFNATTGLGSPVSNAIIAALANQFSASTTQHSPASVGTQDSSTKAARLTEISHLTAAIAGRPAAGVILASAATVVVESNLPVSAQTTPTATTPVAEPARLNLENRSARFAAAGCPGTD